jgi:hypothetical protein
MNGPAHRRWHSRSWSFAAAGIAVAAVAVLGFGPPGEFLPRGTVCELGGIIGTYSIWAPTGMVNIPDGGNVGFEAATAEVNYTFTSGSLSVGTFPRVAGVGGGGVGETVPEAGIFASYANWNFTFYHTVNVTKTDVSSNPCTQPYVASISFSGGFCHSDFSVIPIPDNSTDSTEPHVWNATTGTNSTYHRGCPDLTPGAYVRFDATLNLGGTGVAKPFRWDLCNYSQNETLFLETVAQVPVVVTVPSGSGSISATGFLTWDGSEDSSAPTATYNLPGGWVWTLGPVGPVTWAIDPFNAPIPGLLAFERSAC